MNPTAEKFGHPETLLAEFEHWVVLLRPAQVTLGSLVLLCRDRARRFGELGPEAGAELAAAARRIESVLGDAFRYDKINYLMLMMVDPDVHFHVIPRYASERAYADAVFTDPFWPGPPDVTKSQELPEATRARLLEDLRGRFR